MNPIAAAPFPARLALLRRLLDAGEALPFRARGVSMLPTVWPGETLNVAAATARDVQPGDLVVFARAGHFIVHRVVGRSDDGDAWVTRGDARLEPDALMRAGDFLGVVTGARRLGRERALPRERSLAARGFGWVAARSSLARRALCRADRHLVHPVAGLLQAWQSR